MLTPQPLPATCGLLICSPAGWLLGHSTDTPFWDLPKGKMEPHEDPLEAALRECEEETGLDLRSFRSQFKDLGLEVYNRKRGKTLRLFQLTLEKPLDLAPCSSRTWVRRGDRQVLDMDAFAWIQPERIVFHVKPRMAKYLRRRGLLLEPDLGSTPVPATLV